MNLTNILLLSGAAGFVIIAIHQAMTVGASQSYWAVMCALILFFIYQYRKRGDK